MSDQDFNQFRIMGNNENSSLGVKVNDPTDKVFTLCELTNKKLISIGVGDQHTLVVASGCNCVDILSGKDKDCKGFHSCNGGPDVFSWGNNKHGQVDGTINNEVQTPQIIPFFMKMKPQYVTHVAACRSRSVAVLCNNDVYEWGYVSDKKQFDLVYQLPQGKVIQVEIGLTFNMFLMSDCNVFMSGQIEQNGETVMNTEYYGLLINLKERLFENDKIEAKFV